MRSQTLPPGPGSFVGRAVLEGKPVSLVDAQADPDPEMARRSRSGGVRSMVGVPLIREGIPIGAMLLQRTVVEPFTEKQIELAATFADQAVIAIENVRLFDEIQEKSRQLEEASKHKSQSISNSLPATSFMVGRPVAGSFDHSRRTPWSFVTTPLSPVNALVILAL